MDNSRARGARQVTPHRRGAHTTSPAFDAWFKKTAPAHTNREMIALIRDTFDQRRSYGAIQQLRLRLDARQTLPTRRRAHDTRNVQVGEPTETSHQQREIHALKVDNQSLMRRLAESKAKTADLVDAVYRAALQSARQLDLPNVVPVRPLKRAGTSETAIAVLADWQLAKATATYNSDVCEERIERYGDRLIRLVELQRKDHPVNRLLAALLGDLLEGELIFPGQPHLIDASLFRQVMVSGPRILGNFLRRMLGVFEWVDVDGVIGNHGSLGGRSRRDYHPESNADAMMYEATRMVLQNEKRLRWAPNVVERERKWYSVPTVGKYGFLLFHGDQVKGGFAGFPWYGFGRRIMGWRNGAIPEPFHYALSGHFHTPVRGLYGGIRHWGSGSTESSNTYAAENLAAQGTPSQWLLFCHPDKGVSAEYEVHLS